MTDLTKRPIGKPFKKGISGNPSGRRREIGHVRDLARQYTEEAIDTLAEIMRDKTASSSARAAASNMLLERAWGKSTQIIEAVVAEKTIDIDEAARRIAFMLNSAIERGVDLEGDYTEVTDVPSET